MSRTQFLRLIALGIALFAFASGHADTAERVDEILEETGFAQTADASLRPPLTRRRSRRRPKRR